MAEVNLSEFRENVLGTLDIDMIRRNDTVKSFEVRHCAANEWNTVEVTHEVRPTINANLNGKRVSEVELGIDSNKHTPVSNKVCWECDKRSHLR